MSFEELERALRDHYQPEGAEGTAPTPSPALEERLVAQFDERAPTPRRGGVLGFIRAHKPVFAAAASIAFLVGACAVPVEVETDLGIGLTLIASSDRDLPVEDIARAAAEGSGAEEVSVEASVHDGTTRLQIGLWGADVGAGVVTERLRDEFPELGDVRIDDEVLEGRVETNLGGMLMHDLFDRSLADDDLDVARARVVAALRARGIEGDVEVEVQDVPGGRQIKVGVRQMIGEAGDTDGDPDSIHDAHERRIKMRRLHRSDSDGTEHIEEDVDIERVEVGHTSPTGP